MDARRHLVDIPGRRFSVEHIANAVNHGPSSSREKESRLGRRKSVAKIWCPSGGLNPYLGNRRDNPWRSDQWSQSPLGNDPS